MRTRNSLRSLNLSSVGRVKPPGRAGDGGPPPPAAKPVLLLVSDDSAVGESLRRAGSEGGRLVVQAAGLAEALMTVRSAQVAAVLLDLDLPAERAWVIADVLLQEPECPPLILLTDRRDQFEVCTAMRAGSLVDKSASLARLAEVVDQALGLPESNRVERNAIQRVVIRWLRPCAWSVPVAPAHRCWGLNE